MLFAGIVLGAGCVYDWAFTTMSDSWKRNPQSSRSADADEPPPFWGTWRRIYIAIAVYVAVLVLALYWMTVALNR